MREQNVSSVLSGENEETRIAAMKGRFKNAPSFDDGFLEQAMTSIEDLEPFCVQVYQVTLRDGLKEAYQALSDSPLSGMFPFFVLSHP